MKMLEKIGEGVGGELKWRERKRRAGEVGEEG